MRPYKPSSNKHRSERAVSELRASRLILYVLRLQMNLMQQSMALQQQLSQRYGAVSPNGTPLAPPMAMQVPPPMMMMQPQSPPPSAYANQPSFQAQPSFRAGATTAFSPSPPPPSYMSPAPMGSPMKAPQQQQAQTMVAVPNGAWTSSLFGCCFSDTFVCLGPSWPCLFAENSRKLKGGAGGAASTFWAAYFCALCCPCLSCIYGAHFRKELREKYGLPAEPCGGAWSDCLIYGFCAACATCQEAREMRAREGWHSWKD